MEAVIKQWLHPEDLKSNLISLNYYSCNKDKVSKSTKWLSRKIPKFM